MEEVCVNEIVLIILLATLGSRTMLDSLIPAIDKLDKGIEYAVDAAYQGALNTEKMASSAGRSSYVPTSSLHVIFWS